LKIELAGGGEAVSGEQSRLAALLAGLPEAEASAVLQELWSLAGVEPVGGRGPAEIAHRLVERAEGRRPASCRAGQADAVRAFLAVSDRPGAALDAVSALAGPQARGAGRGAGRLAQAPGRPARAACPAIR
jgi:ATP phosphoribosyltransferase regulatory subunit